MNQCLHLTIANSMKLRVRSGSTKTKNVMPRIEKKLIRILWKKLRRQMGTMDKTEYDVLYRITDELRAGVTEAREELNAYVGLHGC